MLLFFYWFYSIAHLGLTVFGLRLYRQTRQVGTLLTTLVAVGLVYDNLIQAIGGWIGLGPTLQTLTWMRFFLHQLLLPGVIVAAYRQVRAAGVAWAQPRWTAWAAWVVMLLTILAGSLTRLVGLELEPELTGGIVRYAPVNVVGPPISSITSIGLAGLGGFFLWRKRGWPGLFLISAAVFIAEGALPTRTLRLVFGGGLEVVFLWVMLLVDRRLAQAGEFAASRAGLMPRLGVETWHL